MWLLIWVDRSFKNALCKNPKIYWISFFFFFQVILHFKMYKWYDITRLNLPSCLFSFVLGLWYTWIHSSWSNTETGLWKTSGLVGYGDYTLWISCWLCAILWRYTRRAVWTSNQWWGSSQRIRFLSLLSKNSFYFNSKDIYNVIDTLSFKLVLLKKRHRYFNTVIFDLLSKQ